MYKPGVIVPVRGIEFTKKKTERCAVIRAPRSAVRRVEYLEVTVGSKTKWRPRRKSIFVVNGAIELSTRPQIHCDFVV